jgi:flavorubredoxin
MQFLLAVVGVLAAVAILSYLWLNKAVVTGIRVVNPEGGAGTALVVYHPGRFGFGQRVRTAFVEGLVSNGWRVAVTTASSRTPTDLSTYDLLVVSGPTYWFTPSRPMLSYLKRLRDAGGKPVATILTAIGAGERSNAILQKAVQAANGELVASLLLYTVRPNEDLYGINDAEEIATSAAKEMRLHPG